MKKILMVSSMILVFAASIIMPKAAGAAILGDSGSCDLKDLIIVDQLFAGDTFRNGLFGADGGSLGNLIILDELFSDGGGILNGGDNNLADLFVLDQLFSGNTNLFGGGDNNLANLIILDELFSGQSGILDGSSNNLCDLLVLDQLFAGQGTGLFGTGSNNLANLIILDELFSDGGGLLKGDNNLRNLIILDTLFAERNGTIVFDGTAGQQPVAVAPTAPAAPAARPTATVQPNLANQLSGRILLQVEDEGQAWYVNPNTGRRVFLDGPTEAFNRMSELAVGVSETTYNAAQNNLPSNLQGRFLIRSEGDGQLYYANPNTNNLDFVGSPSDALNLLQNTGLGISNTDLGRIPNN
jgi:hypothetical protein